MELSQLRYFKAVAEQGKISAAAESLFISAPALSASIARLETELGMPLFHRTNNRITLNREGEIFLRYVNQVFNSLECARSELRQSLQQQEQVVGIATLTSNPWVDLLTDFYQMHPDIPLNTSVLRPAQLEQIGIPSQYTFLLAEENELPPAFAPKMKSITLFKDRPTVVVHPQHRFAGRDEVGLDELQDEVLFTPVEETSFYSRLSRTLEVHGFSLPTEHGSPYVVYRHLVEQGLGIALGMACTAKQEAPLCSIPIRDVGTPWTMKLFWRADRVLTANEKRFLEFTKKFFA